VGPNRALTLQDLPTLKRKPMNKLLLAKGIYVEAFRDWNLKMLNGI